MRTRRPNRVMTHDRSRPAHPIPNLISLLPASFTPILHVSTQLPACHPYRRLAAATTGGRQLSVSSRPLVRHPLEVNSKDLNQTVTTTQVAKTPDSHVHVFPHSPDEPSRWRHRPPLQLSPHPPPPPPSHASGHCALPFPASASGQHQWRPPPPPRLPRLLWAQPVVPCPEYAVEPPPGPRRPPQSPLLRLRTVGKRSCQFCRIEHGSSLLFCSGCHCFSGEVLGMEVTTLEARSANDFERSQSEDALGLTFFS